MVVKVNTSETKSNLADSFDEASLEPVLFREVAGLEELWDELLVVSHLLPEHMLCDRHMDAFCFLDATRELLVHRSVLN